MEIYVDDEAKLTLHGLVQVTFNYFYKKVEPPFFLVLLILC
jgi:hypothetical protein